MQTRDGYVPWASPREADDSTQHGGQRGSRPSNGSRQWLLIDGTELARPARLPFARTQRARSAHRFRMHPYLTRGAVPHHAHTRLGYDRGQGMEAQRRKAGAEVVQALV
jgi:hypothetical protein